MHTQTRGSAESALNKKEEDKEGEEERISFILARFAARKNDPTYSPDTQERRKARGLLYEGYSVEQIATAIDHAFDTRPATAKPVRGFGFIVAYVHRHLGPPNSLDQSPSTEDSTEGTSPSGEPTGMTTEAKAAVDADITPLQGTSGDPLARVYTLLRAASIRGLEGIEDVHYDLPGIRLGLRQFLEGTDPFLPDEVYDAALAAVSRTIQPDHLVGYTRAVLENTRAEVRQRERRRQRTAEMAHIVRDDGKRLPEAPSRLLAMEQDVRYPRPDTEALALWQSALRELELQMTRATFDTRLKPTTLLTWELVESSPSSNGSTRVVLGVPNGYVKDWLENRLLTPIQRTLRGIAGQPVEIAFQVDDAQEQVL